MQFCHPTHQPKAEWEKSNQKLTLSLQQDFPECLDQTIVFGPKKVVDISIVQGRKDRQGDQQFLHVQIQLMMASSILMKRPKSVCPANHSFSVPRSNLELEQTVHTTPPFYKEMKFDSKNDEPDHYDTTRMQDISSYFFLCQNQKQYQYLGPLERQLMALLLLCSLGNLN